MFISGLTDVQVSIEVTDTVTGEVQTYENAIGEPFELVRDTASFAGCDA